MFSLSKGAQLKAWSLTSACRFWSEAVVVLVPSLRRPFWMHRAWSVHSNAQPIEGPSESKWVTVCPIYPKMNTAISKTLLSSSQKGGLPPKFWKCPLFWIVVRFSGFTCHLLQFLTFSPFSVHAIPNLTYKKALTKFCEKKWIFVCLKWPKPCNFDDFWHFLISLFQTYWGSSWNKIAVYVLHVLNHEY